MYPPLALWARIPHETSTTYQLQLLKLNLYHGRGLGYRARWRAYAPATTKSVELDVTSDLRHNGTHFPSMLIRRRGLA
jgi:hypothetical protein